MIDLPFLHSLPAEERAKLPEAAQFLAEDGIAWFAPVGEILPERNFHNIAQIIAAAGAPASPADLAQCARFCMWMYLLDYYADEVPGVTLSYLEELHGRVEAVLAGAPLPQDSPTPFIEWSLKELLEMFAGRPAAPALLPVFKKQICGEIAGTRRVRHMSEQVRAGAAVSMEEFLVPATQCVNHISCSMSLLFALGDALTARDLDMLAPALLAAARAVRMANDLRTHKKDEAEGMLHCLSFGWTADELSQDIQASVRRCDEALAKAVAAGVPARSAEGIRRITHLGVEIYGVTDIRYEL